MLVFRFFGSLCGLLAFVQETFRGVDTFRRYFRYVPTHSHVRSVAKCTNANRCIYSYKGYRILFDKIINRIKEQNLSFANSSALSLCLRK